MDKFLIEYMLVPSVITIIIVYLAANAMLKGMGLKIHAIVAITMYIVLIYSGFYAIFAPLMYSFMLFFVLIIGVMVFFVTRIVPPSKMATFGKVASKVAEKRADISIIRRSLDVKSRQIEELADMVKKMDIGDREKNTLNMMIHQARTERDILASQIHELDKYKDISTSESFASQEATLNNRLSSLERLIMDFIENVRTDPELIKDAVLQQRVDRFQRNYWELASKLDKDKAKLN